MRSIQSSEASLVTCRISWKISFSSVLRAFLATVANPWVVLHCFGWSFLNTSLRNVSKKQLKVLIADDCIGRNAYGLQDAPVEGLST